MVASLAVANHAKSKSKSGQQHPKSIATVRNVQWLVEEEGVPSGTPLLFLCLGMLANSLLEKDYLSVPPVGH